MVRYLALFLLLFCVNEVFAGSVAGIVTDAANGTPLTGVVVTLKGTDYGAVTDADGRYNILNIADSTYEVDFSYITYVTLSEQLTIKDSKEVTLNASLKSETTQLKAHEVTASKITNTEKSVIMEIRQSNSIVSGISASQIARTMDRNAGDVVKRIPGITIQDDRFIVVRGLADRYNTVWLNDAGTPSSETDKKSFSFDLIPSGLIDRILIYKTPSAELPGDFAGGMVKIYTTTFTDANTVSVNVQASSREYTTGSSFNYQKASSTDWLGYDDGSRKLPGDVPAYLNKTDPNINSITKSFANDWNIYNKPASPDTRLSLALSNVLRIKKVKLANTFGLSYANTNTNLNITREDWDSTNLNYHYKDVQSTNSVSTGIIDNIGMSVGNTRIEFKNLYNQLGRSAVTVRTTVDDTLRPNDPEIKAYQLSYESRATYSSQLTGTHKNNDGTRKYTWAFGYNDLFRDVPDLRRIKYAKQVSDSVYAAQISNAVDIINGGGRYYESLYEKKYSFSQQFTQQFKAFSKDFEFNAGSYLEYTSRYFATRQFGYTIKPSRSATTIYKPLPINEIFSDTTVGEKGKFIMDEVTNTFDTYNGTNKLAAGFLSLKATPIPRLNIILGARYEYDEQHIHTYFSQDTLDKTNFTGFLLPSLNASYSLTENTLARVAYGVTLNRPEFREEASNFYYDFDDLFGVYGSLAPHPGVTTQAYGALLNVAEIHNVDARYEWYPAPGELVHVGGFYKYFKDPIQRIILAGTSSDNEAVSFINGKSAYCYGAELDVRKSLSTLDNLLHTRFFKDLMLVGNLTLAKSQLTIDTSDAKSQVNHSPLQGQSSYVVNAGFFYQNNDNGFQGSLLYNVYGARIYALGQTVAGYESIGELPFHSLDAVISKTFYKHYQLNFGVQNLLGSEVRFVKDVDRNNIFDASTDKTYKSYQPGRYYTVGIKVHF